MIALLLAHLLCVDASAGALPLPPRAQLVLPPSGVEAGWVIEPAKAGRVRGEVGLSVDSHGEVWLTGGHRALFVPQEDALFRADRPFQQLTWLGDAPVVRSYAALGRFVPAPDEGYGMPQVRFVPLADIPLTSWRMAPAGVSSVYVTGYNPRKKVSQIAIMSSGQAGLRVIFESKARIADVAGDAPIAYFATGRAIWRLDGAGAPGSGPPKLLFVHPRAAIRRILYVPGAGVFYATDDAVGFAGGPKNSFDFLHAANCQIATAGDDLYVMMGPLSSGVLRIRGLAALASASR